MKKILRVTGLLAIALFFISFVSYQTGRMTAAAPIQTWEVLLGKAFLVSGVEHSSGFNLDLALAMGAAVLAALCAWLIRGVRPMRVAVLLCSLAAFVFFTRCTGVFGKSSSFVTGLDAQVRGGISFRVTLPFALVLTVLLINIIICVSTQNFSHNLLKFKWYFIMVAPAILFIIVFFYVPLVGIVIVFLDYNISDVAQSTWVGLKWFRLLVDNLDGEFGRTVLNTVVIGLGKFLITTPAPILLALMFNECRNVAFKRTLQTVSYLPHFISWSIIGGLVIQLFSSQYTLLNGILRALGKPEYYLLNEVGAIQWTLILTTLWKTVGWSSIIYMAALMGVNPELYESAKLDGAGRVAQTWHITLPGISHMIVMQAIFAAPSLLSDNFDQALNLVYPMTVDRGKTLSMYIYEVGVRGRGNLGLGGNYSYSTAIGLVNSFIALFMLLGANAIGKRINEEGAIW